MVFPSTTNLSNLEGASKSGGRRVDARGVGLACCVLVLLEFSCPSIRWAGSRRGRSSQSHTKTKTGGGAYRSSSDWERGLEWRGAEANVRRHTVDKHRGDWGKQSHSHGVPAHAARQFGNLLAPEPDSSSGVVSLPCHGPWRPGTWKTLTAPLRHCTHLRPLPHLLVAAAAFV